MKERLLILFFNLLIAGALLLSGCSPEGMLSEVDKEILDTAAEEYIALKDTMSPDEAREELVARLNAGYDGITSTELGEDGYTIFIEFSDDDFAAINTFEPGEFPPQPSGNSYYLEHGKLTEQTDPFALDIIQKGFIHTGKTASENTEEKIIPQSKKILILNPQQDNDEVWYDVEDEYDEIEEDVMFPDYFKDYLKEYGWTDDDIDIKSPVKNVTLEDYFGFGEYGIIMYYGHGGSLYGGKGKLYIQGCPASDALFQNNRQYVEWKEERKLIVGIDVFSSDLMVYVSLDLLKEKMNVLPSSYVHFSTCYGFRAASAFYDKGAKVFLGWDKPVSFVNADKNMFFMLKLMLDNNYSLHEAYLDETISKVYMVYPSTFNIYPDPSSNPIASNFYLPAWINLEVTGIPEGTSFIRASVYDKDSDLLTQDDKDVSSGETQIQMEEVGGLMLVPEEEARVEARAFDSNGKELADGETTETLNAGSNDLQVSLTSSIDWFSMESETDEDLRCVWGSSATDVYAVGENGTIVHYDGTKWSPIDTGLDTSDDLNAVWGLSATDVYVGGKGPTFLHYDGSSWSPLPLKSSDNILGIYSVEHIWGVSPTNLFIVTFISDWFNFFRFNGSILSLIATPNEDYVDYKFSLVNGLWGRSSSDVYLATGSYNWGYIYHYDGGEKCSRSLKTDTENEDNTFSDVWGSAADDVFAVGGSGRIYHYDGSTWSRMDSGTQEDISCVWGSSSSDVHAAGVDTFFHYDGSVWEPMEVQSGTFGSINDIWVSQDGKGFAVGGNGDVYVYGIP